MPALVFDLETVSRPLESFDEVTREILISKGKGETPEEILASAEEQLTFSPYTGTIVCACALDADTGRGGVFLVLPEGVDAPEMALPDGVNLTVGTEKELLEWFWRLAEHYDTFVTYNGRGFDAPYLILKSLILGVRPTKDLMEGRYPYQQRSARHVDLQDELTFFGAIRASKLAIISAALSIPTPKEEMDGSQVGPFYRGGRYAEIAKYNCLDVQATAAVYRKWRDWAVH